MFRKISSGLSRVRGFVKDKCCCHRSSGGLDDLESSVADAKDEALVDKDALEAALQRFQSERRQFDEYRAEYLSLVRKDDEYEDGFKDDSSSPRFFSAPAKQQQKKPAIAFDDHDDVFIREMDIKDGARDKVVCKVQRLLGEIEECYQGQLDLESTYKELEDAYAGLCSDYRKLERLLMVGIESNKMALGI